MVAGDFNTLLPGEMHDVVGAGVDAVRGTITANLTILAKPFSFVST